MNVVYFICTISSYVIFVTIQHVQSCQYTHIVYKCRKTFLGG